MAEEIACPTCEVPNDPWNELCEACGAELHADASAPVHDDATDGDEFVAPDAAAESGSFEGVEEERAYDEGNPDYGVDENFAAQDAQEYSDDAFDEGHGLAEDTGADDAPFSLEEAEPFDADQPTGEQQIAGHEVPDDPLEEQYDADDYVLEEIEPESEDGAQEASPDDAWSDEADSEQDEQFDGGAPLEASVGDEADDWSADQVAADGGAPFEDSFGEPVDELSTDSDVDGESEFRGETADDSEADFEQFGAQEDSEVDDSTGVVAESEVDEEPPPPPELEAILNPERVDRTPIEPLPTPGPYTELATLTVLRGGEELGEVAIDFNCTVLGLERTDDDSTQDTSLQEASQPASDEEESFEDLYELEAIEEESSTTYELEENSIVEVEEASDYDLEQASELDEDSDWADDHDDDQDAFGDSEVDDQPAAAAAYERYEDPQDLEEGPVIDLSQFGDEARFASRHSYLFRQNKHYTLYVLSDMGTQLNDELLELGEHRELADGDVIILGGEVALKFNKPAA